MNRISIDRLGAIFTYIGLFIIVSVPFVISVYLGVWPTFSSVVGPLLSILAIYLPVQIIEIGTYVPMLGRGGSYLAFITGNISNLKAPCVMNALEATGEVGTSDKGDVVSTLAVASSTLVTTVVLLIGVVMFVTTDLATVLQAEVLGPAFDNLLAALFGALGVVFVSKNVKIALLPIAVMLAVYLIMPDLYMQIFSVLIPVSAGIAIGWSRWLYKTGRI